MKNLKKVLAGALAVVMAMSLMTGAFAAETYSDLTDADEITHKEAVALMVDLGVISGKPDGSYAPAEPVDRATMAKLITVLSFGGDVDQTAFEGTVTPLTDIDSSWAEGYIKYCYAQGIIAGRGAGIFAPTDNVTVAEAAKMMLVALGYKADKSGYTGDQWAVNSVKDAKLAGLLEDITAKSTDKLTRDDAAQMMFNALWANQVVYSKDIEAYLNNGTMAVSVYNGLTEHIVVLTAAGDNQPVRGVSSDSADIGTSVVYYTNADGLVSSKAVATEAGVTLTLPAGVKTGDYTVADSAQKFLKDNGLKYRDADYACGTDEVAEGKEVTYVNYYTTGTVVKNTYEYFVTAASMTPGTHTVLDVIDALIGGGIAGTEITITDFDDDGYIDVIKVIDRVVVQLTGDAETKVVGEDTQVKVPGIINSFSATNTSANVFGYEGLKEEDVVLYYVDVLGNYYIEKAESVTGTLTAYNATKNTVTINGQAYSASGLNGSDVLNSDAYNLKGAANSVFFLDTQGNIVKALGEKVATKLLYVVSNDAYDSAGDAFGASTQQSQVLFTDGTVAIIPINKLDQDPTDSTPATDVAATTNEPTVGALYEYKVVDGKYTLIAVATASSGVAGADTFADTTDLKAGVAALDSFLVNSKTVFLFRDYDENGDAKDSFTMVTGYANIKSIDNAAGVAYLDKDGYAEYVIVADEGTPVSSAAKDVAYILSSDAVEYYDKDGNVEYVTYAAIVNGAVVDLKAVDGLSAVDAGYALYEINSYNGDGYVDSVTKITTSNDGAGTYYYVGSGTNKAGNDVVVLASTAFSYTADTAVYVIDKDNEDEFTAGGVSLLGVDEGTADGVVVVVASDDSNSADNLKAVAVYVAKTNA